MAREKTTIPATLEELVLAIRDSRSQYTDHLAQAIGAIDAKDYTKGKESLDKAHAEVLALKDLHNGLYRFLPKAEPTGKPKEHAAITMAKEQAAKDKGEKQDKSEKSAPAKSTAKDKPTKAEKSAKGKGKSAKGGSSLDP